MSTTFSNISLYIPHIFANYTKEDVTKVFENLLGKVKNIDFVLKLGKDYKEYNAAYVHFEYWYDTTAARNFQTRVLDPNLEARLVYDEPWFWIVLENKAQKYIPGNRKPRIELDTPIVKVQNASMLPIAPTLSAWSTPAPRNVACPGAPVKADYDIAELLLEEPQVDPNDFIEWTLDTNYMEPVNLGAHFEEDSWVDEFLKNNLPDEEEQAFLNEQIDKEEAVFEEIEADIQEDEANMEEEDQHLVSIDSRYIQTLEAENLELNNRLLQFMNQSWNFEAAYNTEVIKTQALTELIQTLKK
jgi:hypothetical protein